MSEHEEFRSILLHQTEGSFTSLNISEDVNGQLLPINVHLCANENVCKKDIVERTKNNIIIYNNTTIPKNEKKESEKE